MNVPRSSGEQRSQNQVVVQNSLQRDLARFERQASLLELSSALTHEINQPLTAVMGYAQSVQITLRNSETSALPACEAIRQQIDNLLEQALRLRDTLVHHRLSPPRREEPLRPVDINAVVSDARNLVCDEFDEPRPRIELRLGAARATVEADRMELLHTIVCLARNSVESMAGNPTPLVTIETRMRCKDQIEVAVSDIGVGLTASLSQRMFHPFVSNKPGRLGLGLAICHRTVSLLGGGLSAEVNSSGGTKVRIVLPVALNQG